MYGDPQHDFGTFGKYYIATESYVYKIPENIRSEDAAPLQCAGISVYTALTSTARPGDRIGILGIGGLGHLAIQFSRKMGFDTIAFSTSAAKENEAKQFGATEFYLTSEPEKISKPLDVLIVAGNGYPDWEKYVFGPSL